MFYVTRKSVSALKIYVGQWSTTVPDVNEQIVGVDTVTTFPEYNSTDKLNDIALIRVNLENVYMLGLIGLISTFHRWFYFQLS